MSKEKIVQTTLRLPQSMQDQIYKAADDMERSMNYFILQAIRNELKRSEWLDNNEDGKDEK